MPRFSLLCTAFAALFPGLAGAAIDLTPRFIDIFAEGVTLRRLYFSDGDKKYMVSLNKETEVVADSGGAMFRFTKLPDASFLVVRSRHSPTEPFEGQTLDRYRESAKRLVPVGVRGAVIRREESDVYPINQWKSFRITLAYEVNLVQRLQSVTFISMNESDQVALIVEAPEKIFDEVSHRSYQIFRTWQEMLPGDEKAARNN